MKFVGVAGYLSHLGAQVLILAQVVVWGCEIGPYSSVLSRESAYLPLSPPLSLPLPSFMMALPLSFLSLK